MRGEVYSVSLSPEKGTRKQPVSSVGLRPGWGVVDDAHAGPGSRQVSLLALEDIEKVKKFYPDIKPGDFAENITTRGVELGGVSAGDLVRIGERVCLEVTQIGKDCHAGCEIQRLVGRCIMPAKGVFARVVQGGNVQKNDPVTVIKRGVQRPGERRNRRASERLNLVRGHGTTAKSRPPSEDRKLVEPEQDSERGQT